MAETETQTSILIRFSRGIWNKTTELDHEPTDAETAALRREADAYFDQQEASGALPVMQDRRRPT